MLTLRGESAALGGCGGAAVGTSRGAQLLLARALGGAHGLVLAPDIVDGGGDARLAGGELLVEDLTARLEALVELELGDLSVVRQLRNLRLMWRVYDGDILCESPLNVLNRKTAGARVVWLDNVEQVRVYIQDFSVSSSH